MREAPLCHHKDVDLYLRRDGKKALKAFSDFFIDLTERERGGRREREISLSFH